MDVTNFELTWVGWPNGAENLRRLACKFDLDKSERNSLQVTEVHERPGQMGSQVDLCFLACDYLWICFARPINHASSFTPHGLFLFFVPLYVPCRLRTNLHQSVIMSVSCLLSSSQLTTTKIMKFLSGSTKQKSVTRNIACYSTANLILLA